MSAASSELALRRAADLFHEIVAALATVPRLVDVRNEILAEKLRENLRSPEQLLTIAADGFEVCVRALAEAGTPGVMIHECGSVALGEQPWSNDDR